MTSWVIDANVIIKLIIPNPTSETFIPQPLDIPEHIQGGQITVCQPDATFVTADDRYFRRAENFGNIVRLKEFSLA